MGLRPNHPPNDAYNILSSGDLDASSRGITLRWRFAWESARDLNYIIITDIIQYVMQINHG
jgi:hypothetical protein